MRVRAIVNFTYDRIKDVEFTKKQIIKDKWIFKGDEFIIDKVQYKYLSGDNAKNIKAVESLETRKK